MPGQLIAEEVFNITAGDGCKIMSACVLGQKLCGLKVGPHGPRAAIARSKAPREGPQERIIPRGWHCHKDRLDAKRALC